MSEFLCIFATSNKTSNNNSNMKDFKQIAADLCTELNDRLLVLWKDSEDYDFIDIVDGEFNEAQDVSNVSTGQLFDKLNFFLSAIANGEDVEKFKATCESVNINIDFSDKEGVTA